MVVGSHIMYIYAWREQDGKGGPLNESTGLLLRVYCKERIQCPSRYTHRGVHIYLRKEHRHARKALRADEAAVDDDMADARRMLSDSFSVDQLQPT